MIDDILGQLPAHERRRLAALGRVDVEDLARRRLAGEPLQYLEGTAAFADFDVVVDSRVLIPRPETEGLFELVAGLVESPKTIVDLGTGSGVLAIALARRYPQASVYAVDVSTEALDVASGNAESLSARISFLEGSLFDPLPPELEGAVDVVVSNPPYVAASEWDALPIDVRHEPETALVSGPLGTEILSQIASGVGRWLRPNGLVACEIGETQGDQVLAAFSPIGPAKLHQDLSQRTRYVTAWRRR